MNAIVLDTETTNTLEEPIAYDIGWAVVDTETHETIKTASYAVAEVFNDKDLMQVAYFAEKIPQYRQDILSGLRKLAPLRAIVFAFRADCIKYGISEMYAHNARFDDLSLKLTERYLTSSKYRYFLPYGITVCDTLKMSYKAFGKDEQYKAFCKENNYFTTSHRPKMTAEIIYRFLSGQNDFAESHQGLDDVLIEKEILFECLRRGVTDGSLY